MATDKKTVTKVDASKATVIKKAADVQHAAAPAQAEEAVEKKESVKTEPVKKETAEAKKETVKKEAAVKKTAAKKSAAKKETAKEEPAKKPGRKAAGKTAAKKAELKSEIHLQYSGKAYSEEELLKMAKDVWKYDLKQKVGDLASVELYVKPEENIVYYVMNKDFTGSFYI